MTPQTSSSARKRLVGLVVAALLVIGAVTAVYYWKGLEALPKKGEYESGYYFVSEP